MKLNFCYGCWTNANIEIWEGRLGARYVCKSCGMTGWMADPDAPETLTEEEIKAKADPNIKTPDSFKAFIDTLIEFGQEIIEKKKK